MWGTFPGALSVVLEKQGSLMLSTKLVCTKAPVKNSVVHIDGTPYRQWCGSYYALPLGRKKGAKLTPEEEEILNKKRSKKIQQKYDERKKNAQTSRLLEEQSQQGKLTPALPQDQASEAERTAVRSKARSWIYLRKIKALKGK